MKICIISKRSIAENARVFRIVAKDEIPWKELQFCRGGGKSIGCAF
jgi:hypothetical protein